MEWNSYIFLEKKIPGETVLKDVLWTVGRTGQVSPTGVVDPVILEDATITRVTLHNIEQIQNNTKCMFAEIAS